MLQVASLIPRLSSVLFLVGVRGEPGNEAKKHRTNTNHEVRRPKAISLSPKLSPSAPSSLPQPQAIPSAPGHSLSPRPSPSAPGILPQPQTISLCYVITKQSDMMKAWPPELDILVYRGTPLRKIHVFSHLPHKPRTLTTTR